MAYDQDFFVGLTREPDRALSDTEYRDYGIGSDLDDPSVSLGTHHCEPVQTVFPFLPQPIDCPDEGSVDIVTTEDLTTGRWVRFGAAAEDVSLADRIAVMPLLPDYVQVFVSGEFSTRGGNNGCLATVAVIASCPENVNGSLTKEAGSPTAAFEFGGTLTTGDEVVSAPLGFLDDSSITGMLRRPIDGLSYAGNSTNEASVTLIPWAEFIADPTATVEAHAEHVHIMWQHAASFRVRLWWITPRSEGRVCLVGCA